MAIASSSLNPVPHHHQKFIYKTAMLLLKKVPNSSDKVHKFKSLNRMYRITAETKWIYDNEVPNAIDAQLFKATEFKRASYYKQRFIVN